MKIHKDQIPSFEEWMSRQYKYMPIWKTYSEMVALLGKEVSDKIMTDEGVIYDEIISGIKKHYNIDAFDCESTPSTKYIKEGQVYIHFDKERIVDFTQLGMPKNHDDYENRTFKYIFIKKTDGAVRKDEIVNFIKSFSTEYKKKSYE